MSNYYPSILALYQQKILSILTFLFLVQVGQATITFCFSSVCTSIIYFSYKIIYYLYFTKSNTKILHDNFLGGRKISTNALNCWAKCYIPGLNIVLVVSQSWPAFGSCCRLLSTPVRGSDYLEEVVSIGQDAMWCKLRPTR